MFLDKPYIHEQHFTNFGLSIENFTLKKISAKGKIGMVAAITEDDFWRDLFKSSGMAMQ